AEREGQAAAYGVEISTGTSAIRTPAAVPDPERALTKFRNPLRRAGERDTPRAAAPGDRAGFSPRARPCSSRACRSSSFRRSRGRAAPGPCGCRNRSRGGASQKSASMYDSSRASQSRRRVRRNIVHTVSPLEKSVYVLDYNSTNALTSLKDDLMSEQNGGLQTDYLSTKKSTNTS